MSERPEADKVETPKPTTPPVRPKSVEKGQEGQPTKTDKPDKPPEKPPEKPGSGLNWGSIPFEDGYVMEANEGVITLHNPDGTDALWDFERELWIGPEGNAMPKGWDAGHIPGSAASGLPHYPKPPE